MLSQIPMAGGILPNGLVRICMGCLWADLSPADFRSFFESVDKRLTEWEEAHQAISAKDAPDALAEFERILRDTKDIP